MKEDQSWIEKSELRILEMIEDARRKFSTLYAEQDFEAQVWTADHLGMRPGANIHRRLAFTLLGSTVGANKISYDPADGLPPLIARVFKSWMVIEGGVSPGYNVARIRAARYFWRFLEIKRPERAISFRWGSLDEADFRLFELFLKEYQQKGGKPLSPDTIILTIRQLQLLADFLAARGICRRINYPIQTVSRRKVALQQLDGRREAAEEKLPAPEVLDAIGSIYHRVTVELIEQVNDWVLILISAIAIMLLTGLRIGELLTLPFDCEVEEEITPKRPGEAVKLRYGLRYWPEKKQNLLVQIRWISPTAEPIIRACINRIKKLTEKPRLRAEVLEKNPDRVPLPEEFADREEITTVEMAVMFGHRDYAANKNYPLPSRIPHTYKWRNSIYKVCDVENYLLEKRVSDLHTIKRDGKGIQKLSETLFISFVGQERFKRHAPCPLLVQPITPNMLRAFMAVPKKGRLTAVFAEFGTTEEQRTLSVRPKSFRHWLNHIAYKGKMPVHLITRYFARENPRDTRDYLHYSPEEVGEYVRDEIRAGRIFGPVAKTYWSLPPEEREDYLLGQVIVGHFTPWGLCVRNLALNPCDKHLNCLNYCPSFTSVKGDKGEIAALRDLQAKTESLLKKAEKAEQDGEEWAKSYVAYHRRTLKRIGEVLARHCHPGLQDGSIVHPFANSLYQINSANGGH